jgi:glycosyltransferase involved in cell wall biosynthesis
MSQSQILLVGNFLSSAVGTRSVCEELSLRLAAHGWKAIETSHKTGRFLRLADMVSSVITRRKEYQVAYVEVYSGLAFLWAEISVQLLSLLQKPILLALHGGGLVNFAQGSPARVRKLLQHGRIVVTPSLFLQAGLQPLYPAIHYLPNAVDVSQYKFQIRNYPASQIIWLRALHKIYQPQLAVKTISYLVQDFNDLTLFMVGPDKKDGSLSSVLELAKSLGVASHIKIIGAVPKSEVPAWLARGDIFLNTTRFESFGVSVLEAALVGLPIVTTNVGELPHLWENEKTALLVPPNHPETMAYAVRRILTEPGLATYLSQNARRKAAQFDWGLIFPRWENLFKQLLSSSFIH